MLDTVEIWVPEDVEDTSIPSMQQAFEEKAFCIVSDEMWAKLQSLCINENDIAEISIENRNHEYLELIDIYFTQVQELRKILEDYHMNECRRFKSDMHPNEFQKMIDQQVKLDLLAKLSYDFSLKKLFESYEWKWQKVINKSYFRNFSYLVFFSTDWTKYQFDWDLAIEFFELAEQIERRRKSWEDNYDVFDEICYAYNNLYEKIQKPELFNDLLRLCISTWKEHCIYLLKVLKNFDIPSDIEMLWVHYSELMNLSLIAWKNSTIIFNYPSSKLWFLNWKNKDLIISWLEKLWPDFIYVLNSNSWFINHIIERFPERFIEFCANLKWLADYSDNNEGFYRPSLIFIKDFIVDYPDGWDYLLKVWEIFGESIPWMFSIWKSFINDLFKYFPENYEEILLEIRDIWKHVHEWNEWHFLTYWIKFLAQFLEEWKEKFTEAMGQIKRINAEKIKKNSDAIQVFYQDWLDFVSRYMAHPPDTKNWKWIEICEKIIKIINKHYSNKDEKGNNFLKMYMLWFNQFIWYQLIDLDRALLDELQNFLEKIWWNKDALRVIKSLVDFVDIDDINTEWMTTITSYQISKSSKTAISYTLSYLLKHKKSKIIPFIQNLNSIKDLDLWVNINSVLLGWVSLEYKSDEELQELFAGANVEDTKIYQTFEKLCVNIISSLQIDKSIYPFVIELLINEWQRKLGDIKRWIVQIKDRTQKRFNKTSIMPFLIEIQNAFAESLLDYFEKVVHQKINIKFRKEFKVSRYIDDALINQNLIELYKMYSSTRINRKQVFELIQKYLNWKVYTWKWEISKTYPYNRKENEAFAKQTLKDNAGIWLSRNERIFEIKENESKEEKVDNISEWIAHHLKVANEKLKLLELKDEKWNQIIFQTHWDLRNYFNLTLKKEREKYEVAIFNDLELQIKSIETLLKNNNAQKKKISKIKVYHELEPLKIAMMWNWVDGSCLSYYNPIWNYWSAITNALEVNKWVFYIEDEHWNIIARILVWIDNNWNLEVHPMYLKWNIEISLKRYFDEYIDNIAQELWVTKQWDRYDVKILFCERWYEWD